MTTCLNCENTFEGNFCNQCGQKAATHRLAFHDIWHDLQHSFSHLDKGILYNLRTIIKPTLILEYIAGKRVKFYNPILYVIIIAGLLAYFERQFYISKTEVIATGTTGLPYQIGHEIGAMLAHYAKYMKLVIILPLAFFITIVFRKTYQFRYFENLYIVAFLSANAALVNLLVFPVSRYLDSLIFGRIISFVLIFAYTWLIYKKDKPVIALFKTILVMMLSYTVTVIFFLLLALVVLWVRGL